MHRLYSTSLVVFIFLMVVIAAVACGREPENPTATVTPAGEPMATASPTQESSLAEPTPLVTEPAASSPDAVENSGPGESSLRVISARSASVPSRVDLGRVANTSPLVAQQMAGGDGDLTVSVNGSVTVEADEAYVVIVPSQVYGPGGPQPVSSRDRADVIARLVDIGISEDDIEFESTERYGPPSISIEVGIEELPDIGDQVLDVVEEVMGRAENRGVRFSLSEGKCDQALSLARREAIPQAHRTADDLAEALGLARAGVTGAVEYPLSDLRFGPQSVDTCGSQFVDPFLLRPFDAEPELEVSVGLQVTYAIEPN